MAQKNERKLDIRDVEGQTPLMLATIYGNTRVVRRLLISGANRHIKNRKNETPLKVAEDNEFRNISRMLNDNYSLCDMVKFYCNVKIDYRPKKRKLQIPLVFLITTLVCIGITNVILYFTYHYAYIIEGVIFGLMLLIYFSLLWGPKKYPPKEQE